MLKSTKILATIMLSSLILFGCEELPLQPVEVKEYSTEIISYNSVDDVISDSIYESETIEDFQLSQIFGCLNLIYPQIAGWKTTMGCYHEQKVFLNSLYHRQLREEDSLYNLKLQKYEGLPNDSIVVDAIMKLTTEHEQNLFSIRRYYTMRTNKLRESTLKSLEIAVLNRDVQELVNDDGRQLSIWRTWRATGKVPCLNDK